MSGRLAQVPPGVQCFVGDEARRRRAVEQTVLDVFEGWDYEEIIPPLFDYADDSGHREVFQPLAEEIQRQDAMAAAVRSGVAITDLEELDTSGLDWAAHVMQERTDESRSEETPTSE